MFCTDGWHYVTEAYGAFSSAAEDDPALADTQGRTRADSPKQRRERELKEEQQQSAQILRALRCLQQVGILLPSGVIAKGAKTLIAGGPRLKGSKTADVDLTTGTIGTGTFWDIYKDEDPMLQKVELERRYGNFLGCPVMVKADEVKAALNSVFPHSTVNFDPSPEQPERRDEIPDGGSTQSRVPPGPKGWGDGRCRPMVQEYVRMLIGPGGKFENASKTSVYQEAYNWIRKLTGFDIKLETVEGWVRPLFKPSEVGINPNPKR